MLDHVTPSQRAMRPTWICAGPSFASSGYRFLSTIAVPPTFDNNVGGVFQAYDTSYFDPLSQLDYVSDRSNASIDVFSSAPNSYVGRIGGAGHLFAGGVGPVPRATAPC